MRTRASATLLLCALGAARSAAARERLAVLVVVEGDPGMADNLTEVMIAKLAEGRDRELVGLREVRGRLGEILKGGSIEACLARPDCLSQVGTAVGATRAVVGRLHREEHMFSLVLLAADTRTGVAEAEVRRRLPDDMEHVISGVRAALDDLFGEQGASIQRATKPSLSVDHPERPESKQAISLQDVPHNSDAPSSRNGSSLASYATYGLTALAIVSFSAAVVLGNLGEAAPAGKTRAETQRDLESRNHQAALANGLFVAGGALLAVTAGIVIWRWR